jgi:5-formyltetrahydrofolate cyclo-ligase
MQAKIKHQLRQVIKAKCIQFTVAERKVMAEQLLLNCLPLLTTAQNIAVYHAYGWEIDLTPVINHCLANFKRLYQPIAYKEHRDMHFSPYDPMLKTIFYAPDYVPAEEIQWYNLDLILLPVVAIDQLGYRLGKGGGYYDTTLATSGRLAKLPVLCGVGFSCQSVDKLPREEWDLKLDYFVSENGLVQF